MTDLEKLAAWTADLMNRNGMAGNVFDKNPKPMTAADVLQAAGIQSPTCECNCHYGGSCSPYPCCKNANVF